jgi:hypothetical protein
LATDLALMLLVTLLILVHGYRHMLFALPRLMLYACRPLAGWSGRFRCYSSLAGGWDVG